MSHLSGCFKSFGAIAVASLSISVFGQPRFPFAYEYYHGNTDIIRPQSSIPGAGRMHSHVLFLNRPAMPAPNVAFDRFPSFGPSPQSGPGTYGPPDLRRAYGIPDNGGTGAIAIVDAYDLPTSLTDFNTFSQNYGLPQETSTSVTASTNQHFQVVYASGSQPASAVTNGWAVEEDLDIEYSHGLAPNAKIYLVEAASSSGTDLYAADQLAASLPGVKEVSGSWGGGEYPQETQTDSIFNQNGVVYFFSTGDDALQEYPAESPDVVAVGGTSLQVNSTGYISESGWAGSGGGPSAFESRPAFQNPVQNVVGAMRGDPDISSDADPNTGVMVFSDSAFGNSPTWVGFVGGTSLACPCNAAITNDRGSWTHDSNREELRIYFNLGGPYYRDITAGGTGFYSCMPGWDFVTGIGSPNGMFPPYSPPENLVPEDAQIYQKVGSSQTTNEVSILSAVEAVDGIDYRVGSVSTSVGQAAAVQANFRMDKPLSQLTQAVAGVYGYAPLGTTLQLFAFDYDKSDSTFATYVYIGSTPGVGLYSAWKSTSAYTVGNKVSFGNVNYECVRTPPTSPTAPRTDTTDWEPLGASVTLTSNFIQPGTNAVSIVARAVQPTHVSAAPFTYAIDQIVLNEETAAPWDVNLPL